MIFYYLSIILDLTNGVDERKQSLHSSADEQRTSREGTMSRLKDIVDRHAWLIFGFIIVLFMLLSLRHNDIPGQLCLIAAISCTVVTQLDRSVGRRRAVILGPSAIILAVVGLVLIWPKEIGALMWHLLEGLAAIKG